MNKMIVEGDIASHQRKDLRVLIRSKRNLGFKPIIMLDANDDWLKQNNKTFRNFIKELQLVDSLHQHQWFG